MKTIALLFASVIALFGLDLSALVQKAKQQNKTLLIELTSPRCHYCKIMDKTLATKQVQEALQCFYFVKVDVTKESLPNEIFYSLTPTFLFFSSDGKLVKKVPGAWKSDDFVKILAEVKRCE